MKALLIDYEYCTGCHTCEVACKKEHGFEKSQFGIKVFQNGPFRMDEKHWQFDFVPLPTDLCDLCAERTAKGKDPSCVSHCQAFAITAGELGELTVQAAKKPKNALFTIEG